MGMETDKRNIKMNYYYYYRHLKHKRLVIVCIHARFRDEEEKTEEVYIFAYHYVLKDKNPVQICPIYKYITPTKHDFVSSVTGH
jgi:hypothetical protein